MMLARCLSGHRRCTLNILSRNMSSEPPAVNMMTDNGNKFKVANRVSTFGTNLWAEFSSLANEHKATNIGQGFPDFPVPEFLQEEVRKAVAKPSANWYTRAQGHPRLVKVLSEEFSPMIGREIDPMSEIITTVGAYESIFCAINAFVDSGDEVIIIEPHFDCYKDDMIISGGKLVRVPLRPQGDGSLAKNWVLDPAEFEGAFTSRTKAVILTTPHNPVGKMFTQKELEYVASVCKRKDVLVISDEVYERVTFDDNKHVRICSLPGMWDRTITVGSAGKTFSVTGWKIGWAFGASHLITQLNHVASCSTFSAPTILQEAVAGAFEYERTVKDTDQSYFKWLPAKLQDNCKKLADAFSSIGMTPVWPDGGYFMLVDTSPMHWDFSADNTGREHDVDCVKWLTREFKLATIPTSVFYCDDHKDLGSQYIRVCCAKSDATIDAACAIVRGLSKKSHC